MKNFVEWLEVRDQEFHDSINENLKEKLKLGALMGAQAAGIAGLGGLEGLRLYNQYRGTEPKMPKVSQAIDKPAVSIADAAKNRHNRAVSIVEEKLGVSEAEGTVYGKKDSNRGDKLITTFEIRLVSEQAKEKVLSDIYLLNYHFGGKATVKLSNAPSFYNNENTDNYLVSVMTDRQ